MMELLLSRENLLSALHRVEKNKGSHGVDGMSVKEFTRTHQTELALDSGAYRKRNLRAKSSPSGRNPETEWWNSAIRYPYRDRTIHHHDRLMAKLAERITDKNLLKLIRKYLQSGVMVNGLFLATDEGTPQGGPLSPLLSNIVLDELDKELEKRDLRLVRYADDCNIYVKTGKAGFRVKQSVTQFIEKKLKLIVNQEKSAVDRPWKRKFLGFTLSWDKEYPKVKISKPSLKRVKSKIKEITSRKSPVPMEIRIQKLNQYLTGWCGYYALADTPSVFQELDGWIRIRLRMCVWKQWKLPRTKVKKLVSLGVPKDKAYEWGNSRKKYWRIACIPILHKTLGNQYWSSSGLRSLTDRYKLLRNMT